jgi:hypothetical protein
VLEEVASTMRRDGMTIAVPLFASYQAATDVKLACG